MKSVFKIIVITILILSFVTPLVSDAIDLVPYGDKDSYVYLFVGLDNTSGNTDTIIAVFYNSQENSLNFLHIPRDTFFNYEGKTGKINQVFKSNFINNSKNDALQKTMHIFGEILGVSFDGFSAVNINAFTDFVDAIGGVFVNLPSDFIYEGRDFYVRLKKGENLLDGKTAEIFVRHRQGYKQGDLTRIEAQKIFITGVYNTLMHRVEYSTLINAFSEVKDDFISNFSLFDFVIMLSKHGSKFKDAELNFATLPGEAIIYNQISYYVANRIASENLLEIFYPNHNTNFDKNKRLILAENDEILSIYNSKNISYNIINSENTNKIKLH